MMFDFNARMSFLFKARGIELPNHFGKSERAKMLRVTLDTNVIRDFIDPSREGHETAKKIFNEHGKTCLLCLTTRLQADVPNGTLRAQLDALPVLKTFDVSGSVVRIGYSVLGGGDVLAGPEDTALLANLRHLLFPGGSPDGRKEPNRIADIDHLLAHNRSGADYFVTNERAMLLRSAALEAKFGIKVISPDALCSLLAEPRHA